MCRVVLLGLCALLVPSTGTAISYVVNAQGTGDFPTIQAAVDSCLGGEIIELEDGIFRGDGNRDVNYLGKAITIRSQTGNREACIIDCQGSALDPHRGFLFITGEGAESVLQGLTIVNGYVAGQDTLRNRGGGVICAYASGPRMLNCAFCGNTAEGGGGGVHCRWGAAPEITDCLFAGNHTDVSGGGLSMAWGCSVTVAQCSFENNTAAADGGGVGVYYDSEAALTACTLSGNSSLSASSGGGGIACVYDPVVTISECIFSDNSSPGYGAGIFFAFRASATVSHTTLFRNSSGTTGGGICIYGTSNVDIERCTFYGNATNAINGGAGIANLNCTVTLSTTIIAFSTQGVAVSGITPATCCDIFGNAGGDWEFGVAGQLGINGNICEDPLFCNPDYMRDLRLQQASPCAAENNPGCGQIGAWPIGCLVSDVNGDLGNTFPRVRLGSIAPNPFTRSVGVQLQVQAETRASGVSLGIFDLSGRLVRSLAEGGLAAGSHVLVWDGKDRSGIPVQAGAYFCRLSTREQIVSRMLLLVR